MILISAALFLILIITAGFSLCNLSSAFPTMSDVTTELAKKEAAEHLNPEM